MDALTSQVKQGNVTGLQPIVTSGVVPTNRQNLTSNLSGLSSRVFEQYNPFEVNSQMNKYNQQGI